jgi:hypothetical protein
MTNRPLVSFLFALAALYEGALGLVFLLAAGPLFQWAGVPPPNHLGYVQFPAALLVIFACMFVAVSRDPVRNRELIPFGMMLKAAYCGIVFTYWIKAGIPAMWKPFAIADLVFLLLFAWAYTKLRAGSESRPVVDTKPITTH